MIEYHKIKECIRRVIKEFELESSIDFDCGYYVADNFIKDPSGYTLKLDSLVYHTCVSVAQYWHKTNGGDNRSGHQRTFKVNGNDFSVAYSSTTFISSNSEENSGKIESHKFESHSWTLLYSSNNVNYSGCIGFTTNLDNNTQVSPVSWTVLIRKSGT